MKIKNTVVIIDPVAARVNTPLMFINDARINLLSSSAMTPFDKQRQNCKFVEVSDKHGWKTMYITTTRDVNKYEELLIDYGPVYSFTMMQCKAWDIVLSTYHK